MVGSPIEANRKKWAVGLCRDRLSWVLPLHISRVSPLRHLNPALRAHVNPADSVSPSLNVPQNRYELQAYANEEKKLRQTALQTGKLREARYNELCQMLKKRGVIPIGDAKKHGRQFYFSLLLTEHADALQILRLKVVGRGKGRARARRRFIKTKYLGRGFCALKKDRTALVRFLMGVLRRDREYDIHDIRAITRWLKRFKLSRAERVAIIKGLGYKYETDARIERFRHELQKRLAAPKKILAKQCYNTGAG